MRDGPGNRAEIGRDFAKETLYWPLMRFWGQRPVAYWVAIGTLAFVVTATVLLATGETRHLPGAVFGAWFGLATLAVSNLTTARQFSRLRTPIGALVDWPEREFEKWFDSHGEKTWGRGNRAMHVSGIAVMVLGTATLLFAHPQANGAATIYLLLVAQPLLFMYGQTAYSLARIVTFVGELGDLPLKLSPYTSPSRAVYRLGVAVYTAALLSAFGYAAIFAASVLEPVEHRNWFLPWLAVLALYPISLFSAGVSIQHRLMNEARLLAVESINQELCKTKPEAAWGDKGTMPSLIELRMKLETSRVWPFSFQAALAFAASAAVLLTQAISLIIALVK